jgi:hypothetical protein
LRHANQLGSGPVIGVERKWAAQDQNGPFYPNPTSGERSDRR